MYLPRRNSLGGRYFWILSSLIVGLIVLNYVLNSNFFYHSEIEKLQQKAEIMIEQFVAMRAFIALQQDNINMDSKGNFEFKYLNPAAVGKGVADILAAQSNYLIKQTRVYVRNPENAPDAFELEALSRFEADQTLAYVFTEADIDGNKVYRHIVPQYADASCMDCHGDPAGIKDVSGYLKEGLQIGDLAGAISVTIPMANNLATFKQNRFNLLVFSFILLVATLTAMLVITSRLVVRPLQELIKRAVQVGQGDLNVSFDDMTVYGEVATLSYEFSNMLNRVKDVQQNLERKVYTRTQELEAANFRLLEGQKTLSQLNLKLSETNRLKNEFLATITHELRTPLTSIVAFCELMLDEIPGSINDEQRDNLLDIKTSSQQLMMLISDILDMAKYDAGRLRLELEKIDLNDLFRIVRRSMSAIAYQNNISFNVDKVDLPLIYGDPERIRQMIFNLVSNAIKFSNDGGRVDVFATAAGDYAAISVKDTGEGIAPEFFPYIFERFRQGDASTKRRRNGTGLGLALVKTLAELQNGKVEVKSEVGIGTEFIMYIPFATKGGEDID